MNSRNWERVELEADLRRALESAEFTLMYQPMLNLETGAVSEVEALLRWNHPKRGLLLPAQFLPLAEETGLLIPIGAWVLTNACRQAQAWRELHPSGPKITVSVNLSARQFRFPQLIEQVAQTLKECKLDPAFLRIEVAEHVMMEHVESTVDVLHALKSIGVQIAVDDFGTGYSALGSLKRFPLDTLKIDRSFVHGLGRNAEDSAIVRAVIAFATALGIDVIAKGIETAAQLQELRELGCRYGQGYYFVNPLAADALNALLGAAGTYSGAQLWAVIEAAHG
jgi:EAL domain-containing protein (putative c-di-GMP-specific phosphodiesterase class I)